MWHPRTGECLQTIQGTSVVWKVAWSPDSKILASVGTEDTLRLWNVDALPTPPLESRERDC
ncbi:MAG: hypothetical protein JO235_24665 [Chroococcidiopsidaceae cyanobacterium CP_BM_RX_35]|nr:hypothetical protein [Chroococcidiopsidaceae cyanobacterium CP_BM_RX_35]